MKTPISMNQMSWPHWLATLAQRSKRIVAGLAVAGILLGSFPVQAIASSWSPTLLVNTESFQSIDDGSGSSDVELRFGVTLNEKIYWDRTNAEFRFSDDIRVDGNITASGTLTVSGDAKTKADLTINSDQGDGNAVLTFGSDTTNETLTFIDEADRFEFSDDLRVSGGLYASGSLIVEDGQTFTIEGITYTFPQSDGSASGKVLKTDGAGVLSWSTDANDGGSGISYTDAASYFVNDTGDTMTGALNIVVTSGRPDTIALESPNTISGSNIHASDDLSSSGGKVVIEGTEATDAVLILDADQGDDAADTWVVESEATGNDLSIVNDTTEVLNLTTAGALQTDSNVTVGSAAAGTDYTITYDGETTDGTLKFFEDESVFQFDSALQIRGALSASGHIMADGNLQLNADDGANDAVLTFGSDTTDETLTFINLADRFEFSDDLRVSGGLYASGSLIVEDGQTFTIEGITYTFPQSDGVGSGRFLTTNGAGTLSWSDGVGSGEILTLEPEYTGSVYFASGTSFVGQLSASGSYSTGGIVRTNFYHWESTKSTMQDYWIATRVTVPENFLRWDPVAPIKLRYRTGSGSSAAAETGTGANFVSMKLFDTTNTQITLNGATELSTSTQTFKTADITGPQSTGTYTTGSGLTLMVRLAALDPADTNDRGFADVGWIKLNWETSLR